MIKPRGRGNPYFQRQAISAVERLMSFYSLKFIKPVVLGTYNDLVLCCATSSFQRDYYICNPYTTEWIRLPPPPQIYIYEIPVGFICDFPSYNDSRGDNDIFQVNADYKCKVVRILPFENQGSFKFKVETFSFETGDWRQSIVSSPGSFRFRYLFRSQSFTYNGMLFWSGVLSFYSFTVDGMMNDEQTVIIGLDPFMMEDNNSTSSSSNGDDIADHYKCCLLRSSTSNDMQQCMDFFGASQGCPRMCGFYSGDLFIWDLKEATHQRVGCDRTGKLSLIHPRTHSLDQNMFQGTENARLLHFDANVKDVLYFRVEDNFNRCNINTGEWSRIAPPSRYLESCNFFPLTELPWPTPVPRLPPRLQERWL